MNISIALTTYNGSKYIKDQLDSIARQTLMPMEIIIFDDASIDDTVDIIKNHQLRDLIKLFVNQKNIGLVANFKKAVSACNPNNYIAFCDQDDIWEEEKLMINWQEIKKYDSLKQPVLVYSDSKLIDSSNKMLYKSFMNVMGFDRYQHNQKTVLFGSLMLGCTMMINPNMRNFFLEMPLNNNYNHDAWMSLVGFYFGKSILIKQELVQYRKHNFNVTISELKKENRINKLFNNLLKIFSNNDYLTNEISIANDFINKYRLKLDNNQIVFLNQFLKLKEKHFIYKKFYFEFIFYKYWINRF